MVIYGAGIIGQHLVRLLRALGSKARVIMVARYPFQEELAQAGGADLVLIEPRPGRTGRGRGRPAAAHHPGGRQPGRRRRPVL